MTLYTVEKAVEALNARVVGHTWTVKRLRHAIHRGQLGPFTRKLGGRRFIDVEGWLAAGSPTQGPAANSAPNLKDPGTRGRSAPRDEPAPVNLLDLPTMFPRKRRTA